MPRYQYRCSKCEKVQIFQHLSTETITDCDQCKHTNSMKKLLSRFSTVPKTIAPKKTGQVTEEYISDAREELKQQKQETLKTP
jgi:putative FmdB family regulatory protein